MPKNIEALDFILVDRRTMRRVHRDFLDDASETDVITFPYGEIVICPAVALDQAAEQGTKVEHEVLLYALHGLLHLAGYDDKDAGQSRTMARAQERWLKRVLR